MTLRSTKPNRCKHCKERMPIEQARHVLHEDCKDAWIAKQLEKQAAARLKKQRAEARVAKALTRQQKLEQKKWADWHADAQKAVNAFIRARDVGLPCISCGTPWAPDFQAGHYRSCGAAKNLALDPRNIHGQCVQCNLHRHSNAIDYRLGLVARCGLAIVEALEADNEPRHNSIDDLKAIRADALAKTKELRSRE